MDRLRTFDIAKLIESVKSFVEKNPIQTAAGSLAFLVASHYLLIRKRNLNVKPSESVVVITGCDSGFGLMTAKKLSSMGYLVVAACLLPESVVDLQGVVALAVCCDITKAADIKLLASKTEELCVSRNARLWAVVNNAGIANSGGIDWVRTYRFKNTYCYSQCY
jgi:hypothetical protein